MSEAMLSIPLGTPTHMQLRVVPLRVGVRRVEALLSGGPEGRLLLSADVGRDEELDVAAARAGREAFGLEGTAVQVVARGMPGAGIEIVYAFAVRPPPPGRRLPSSHVAGASWRSVWEPGPMTSNERSLLEVAVDASTRAVVHGEEGFLFVHPEFTVSELRRVHECFGRQSIDPSNFRKRVGRWVADGRVRELGRRRSTATRPARLYVRCDS